MTELTLFASTYILVFALGLQSLNVNNGHFILAAFTSFVIGAGQMILYKLAPHASWSEIAAYLCGGPFGIISSMKAHPILVRWMKRKPKPEYKGKIPPRPIPQSRPIDSPVLPWQATEAGRMFDVDESKYWAQVLESEKPIIPQPQAGHRS